MSKFQRGNTANRRKALLSKQPTGYLTNEQVLEIRKLYLHEHWTQGRLARHYKRSVGCIGQIVRYETHNTVAIVQEAAPVVTAAAIEESAKRMLALQELSNQNVVQTAVDTDKLIEEAQAPLTDEMKERLKGYGVG
jgi:hypothetical protein